VENTKKPNIVWIYCDELRTDALGCYENDYARMKTPSIDWIAENGVKFSNCFCNSPVCVSSRMSVLTGLYPEDTGVYHNEGNWGNFVLDKPYKTFPEVFAETGYNTADFGKLHLPRELQPWQHRNSEGSGMKELYRGINAEALGIIKSGDAPTMIGGRYPGGRPYPPEKLTQNALEWLKTAEEPYLVRLSYLQPHTPVFPNPPYDTLYKGSPFPDSIEKVGMTSDFERRFAEVVNASKLTSEEVYLAQVYYYGLVAWIDSQVGEIINFLRSSDKIGDTVFVFSADHGASLGENGLYAKHVFAPQVQRVPMLIAFPGTIPAGQVRDDICECLNLARTLFNISGIEAPPQFKGRDLLSSEPSEAIYSTIGFGYPESRAFPNLGFGEYLNGSGWPRRSCIRTENYRLDKNIRMDGKPVSKYEEDIFLADVTSDPKERYNLAGDPEYADIIEKLWNMLDKHVEDRIEPPAEYVRR
jgi:choline-sulfatase